MVEYLCLYGCRRSCHEIYLTWTNMTVNIHTHWIILRKQVDCSHGSLWAWAFSYAIILICFWMTLRTVDHYHIPQNLTINKWLRVFSYSTIHEKKINTRNKFGFDNEPILLGVHIGACLHRYLKLVGVFKN